MCIAIMSPENEVIPHAHLVESFNSNPDGAGFMYAEDGELYIKKGFMTYEDFFKEYKEHETKPCAVHFRIATHGSTDQENTHPFRVGNNLGFIHNGIINNVDCSTDKTKSDTNHFNTKYLSQFYKRDSRFIFKEHFKDVIKSYIGFSKLVFLNNKGHHTIINEDKGVWENGIWYSNISFRPVVRKKIQALPQTAEKEGVFRAGTRVKVAYKGQELVGYIRYFTNGLSVGVYMQDSKQVEVVPMSLLTICPDKTYATDDWVIKIKGDPSIIYRVTGTSKNKVWIKAINFKNIAEETIEVVYDYELEDWSYLGVGV